MFCSKKNMGHGVFTLRCKSMTFLELQCHMFPSTSPPGMMVSSTSPPFPLALATRVPPTPSIFNPIPMYFSSQTSPVSFLYSAPTTFAPYFPHIIGANSKMASTPRKSKWHMRDFRITKITMGFPGGCHLTVLIWIGRCNFQSPANNKMAYHWLIVMPTNLPLQSNI